MYVFYPADELLRIYENPIRDPVSLTVNDAAATVNAGRETTAAGYEQQQQQQQQLNRRQHQQQQRIAVVAADYANVADDVSKRKKERRRDNAGQTNTAGGRQFSTVRNDNGNGDLGKKGRREEQHATGTMQNNRAAGEEAANPLRDLTQPSLNEQLKQLNGNTLKIVQTIAEFAKELGLAMDSHSANVQCLVDDFRKRSGDSRTGDSRTGDSRTGDSRTDISGIQRVWESLLRQVEKDAASHRDVAQLLQQQSTIIDACFYRKVQSRKVFTHRDAYEQMIGKTEEKLQRARLDYKRAYAALLANDDGGAEQELKRAYLESHNAYILQLRATNATTERYQFHCLPGLLGEIGEAYEDVCGLACKFVAGISNAVVERAFVQAKRYQTVMKDAQTVVPMNDLQTIARNMSASTTPRKPPRRLFVAPAPPEQIPMERINQISTLRDELVLPGTSTLSLIEDLRLDYESLTQDIDRLQDALDSLVRIQRKSFEISLYTKMQEMQEEISLKRFDLGVAQLRLAAVQAQKELFGGGEAGQPDGMASRKMSNGSTGSPKLKWLKAFKSLKTSSPTTPPPSEKPGKQATMYHAVSTVVAMSRKNLDSEGGHVWRAYTYRKITPCDACGLVLRGHSLQGCRCRNCKANAHMDCIGVVQPALCPSLAPKKSGGIPLLRRQKTQVADEVPPATQSAEHRRGSGGSTSGTRPFGQPLMLMSQDSSPSTSSLRTSEMEVAQAQRGANKKR